VVVVVVVGAVALLPMTVETACVGKNLPNLRVIAGDTSKNTVPTFAFETTPTVPVTLRGVDYIRLNGSIGGAGGEPFHPVYHSTFSTKFFNKTECNIALRELGAEKYNIVRVFLDPGTSQRSDGINGPFSNTGLNGGYVDNLAQFISAAAANNIYVILTADIVPQSATFQCAASGSESPSAYPNSFLMQQECLDAKARYITLLLQGLQKSLGCLNNVILSLVNELALTTDVAPFSETTGVYRDFNNTEYQMQNLDQRQALADSSFTNWANSAAKAAKAVDDNVLVLVGMFTFGAVSKNFSTAHGMMPPKVGADARVPPRPDVFVQGSPHVDILDVHVYQVPNWGSFETDIETSDWKSLETNTRMPILMGEFGAWHENPNLFKTDTEAADAMVSQQTMSCKNRFVGWLFWTYDTWEQPRLWNLVSGPAIARALSPKTRPNPCAQGGSQK